MNAWRQGLADDALEEIGKYFVAMSFAAEQVGAACKRVDQTEFTGDIVQEIKRLISESVAVIVDLSEGRANVLYETGYAHALEKPTVHICSTDFSQLPFDVRNWNTIKYNRGQTTLLKQPLAERLGKVIETWGQRAGRNLSRSEAYEMQIDFHHAVTYVVARLAGFGHREAEVVAYCAQYVDDATNTGEIIFENGAMYSRICSAHKMLDYRNFDELASRREGMDW
jgi:nucleoside 2-deoxyribosyltransferase